MNWLSCPICSQRNQSSAIRCASCGADFGDPDVIALMGDDAPALVAPDLEAGALSHGKILGFRKEGLEDGTGIRKMVLIGGLLILGGFLIPVRINFEHSMAAWSALEFAPAIPLLFPVVAVLLGITANFAPLEAWQRSALLLVAGLIGIATLPFLGKFSAAPMKFLPLLSFGIVVATWGLIWRCVDARSKNARYLVVAGALTSAIGYLLPVSDPSHALPVELRFYLRDVVNSASPLSIFKTVFNRDPLVFFSTVYLLLPLVALPIAAGLAWRKGQGAWDKGGMLLRPLAWLFVYYLPLGFALFAFNLVDNDPTYAYVRIDNMRIPWETFTEGGILGRFRLLLLSAGFSLWATLPFLGIAKLWPDRAATETP